MPRSAFLFLLWLTSCEVQKSNGSGNAGKGMCVPNFKVSLRQMQRKIFWLIFAGSRIGRGFHAAVLVGGGCDVFRFWGCRGGLLTGRTGFSENEATQAKESAESPVKRVRASNGLSK